MNGRVAGRKREIAYLWLVFSASALLALSPQTATAQVLEASPSSHDFGYVQINTSDPAGTDVIVTLTNTDVVYGTNPLVCSWDTGAHFFVSNCTGNIPADSFKDIEITALPTAFGSHSDTLTISYGATSLEIPVSAEAPQLWISPDINGYTFASHHVGEASPPLQHFEIRNADNIPHILNSPFTKTGDQCSSFNVGLPMMTYLAPSDFTVFSIEFDPTTYGSGTCTVIIDTTAGGSPATDLVVDGTGLDGDLELSQGGFAFADHTIGVSTVETTTTTITNNGNASLWVGAISPQDPECAHFSVSDNPTPMTLSAGGGSDTFDIDFNPTAPGSFSCDYHITNDDYGFQPEGYFVFTVTGTADSPTVNPVVTSLADSGTGSLRQAITIANGNGENDIITFDVSGTITLTSQLPEILPDGTLTVQGGGNITLSGNNAVRMLYVTAGANLTLQNLTMSNGYVSGDADGGGIFNSGTLNLTDCTLSGNSAANGGAISNYGGGTLTVSNSSIVDNTTVHGGGGIDNESGCTANITGSTFGANIAGWGGGIDNEGALTIANCTFFDNEAQWGGGVNNWHTVTITNSTFFENSATGIGGGIHNNTGATATLTNTIVANSTAGGNCSGPITDGGNNLDSAATCGFSMSALNNTDPLLGPSFGDPAYLPLGDGSPAIDVADNAMCAAPPVNNTSQNGVSRPQDGNGDGLAVCDIGSFEANDIIFADGFESGDTTNWSTTSVPGRSSQSF